MKSASDKAAKAAMEIITGLRAAGHVALLAGGCVRDRLLQLPPKDYDVATDAHPEGVLELFPKARRVGAKFGVMLVRKHGCDIEVATFRADGTYSDGRHPDEVRFGTELEDAQRRDFTINGLFLDPIDGRVIDHVGGAADLSARIVRTIGDPHQRFSEDHLRMLRAVRLAARLGFKIDPATKRAIQELAPRLSIISAERIWIELEQILAAPTRPTGWSLLMETGLRRHLCAEWPSSLEEDELIRHRFLALEAATRPVALPFAVSLMDRSVAEVSAIARGLKLSNRLTDEVVWLVRSLPLVYDESRLELADLKLLMVEPAWGLLMELLKADLMARGKDLTPYEQLGQRAARISADRIAPPPLLTGDHLKLSGFTEGPELGRVLKAVYRAQLNETVTTHEEAKKLALQLLAHT